MRLHMARLVDANDLWSDVMMLPHNGDMISSEEVEQAIKDAPTVDAEPVVHGRWVKKTADYVYYYACSECGEPVLKSQWGNDFFSDYCPNCGAKMDGERKDNENP